jgi:hypothetical protein
MIIRHIATGIAALFLATGTAHAKKRPALSPRCRRISAAFGATEKLHQRKQSNPSVSMSAERILKTAPIAAASLYGPTEEATHSAVLMLFVILANSKKLI